MLGKITYICTTDTDCRATVVVQRYSGAICVVQTILRCGTCVVFDVDLVKRGGVSNNTHDQAPFAKRCATLLDNRSEQVQDLVHRQTLRLWSTKYLALNQFNQVQQPLA